MASAAGWEPAGGRHGAGASRAAGRGPGGLQAPPPPLTDSASSPHSSRAVRGRAGARAGRPARASASAQAAAGEGADVGRAGTAAPGRPEVAREGAGSAPSSPLRVRCHRLRLHLRRRRPALTRRGARRRQPPATHRKRARSRHVTHEGWARTAPPIGGPPWKAGLGGGWRWLAGGPQTSRREQEL